ncbi:MAG: hypothetical protein ACLGP3_10150 [Acidobacteriota bacterium]
MPVFESAGYTVEVCASLAALRDVLDEGQVPAAVIVTETEGVSPREAVRLTRACPQVPLVLFRETQRAYGDDGHDLEAGFDLVIPIRHPPAAWLAEIAALIEKSRKARTAGPAEARIDPEGLGIGSAQGRACSVAGPTRSAAKPGKNSL